MRIRIIKPYASGFALHLMWATNNVGRIDPSFETDGKLRGRRPRRFAQAQFWTVTGKPTSASTAASVKLCTVTRSHITTTGSESCPVATCQWPCLGKTLLRMACWNTQSILAISSLLVRQKWSRRSLASLVTNLVCDFSLTTW